MQCVRSPMGAVGSLWNPAIGVRLFRARMPLDPFQRYVIFIFFIIFFSVDYVTLMIYILFCISNSFW